METSPIRRIRHQAFNFNSAIAIKKDLTIGLAEFQMDPPLRFGTEHKGHVPEITVKSLFFVNFFKNVKASLNNHILYYSDDVGLPEKYNITFPDGSYSIGMLSSYVSKILLQDRGTEPFTIQAYQPTNSTSIVFKAANWYVYFKANVSPYHLLGFTSGQFVPASKASILNEIEIAPGTSHFQIYTSINVRTNLSNSGYYGGNQGDIIYESHPNVPVGFTQTDKLFTDQWTDAELLTSDVNRVRIQLVDQNLGPIDTNGEDFSVAIQIRV